MNYNIINTGSDGNCTIINGIIAIDMGVAFKRLRPYVKDLKLVLLTHEHQDHFLETTIKKLAEERPTLRFGCGKWLVKKLVDCGVNKKNIDVYEIDKTYNYKLFQITPFKLYHDVPNCGYKLFMNNKKLIYANDTHTLKGITAKNYDVYLIEANYESREELHNRSYNEYYENRVIHTHLCKEATIAFLLENMGENSIYEFMHQHKERKNNNEKSDKGEKNGNKFNNDNN